MAAAEYYTSTYAHELPGDTIPPHIHPPQLQPKPLQYQQSSIQPYPLSDHDVSYSNTPPPSYSSFAIPPPPPPQQLQVYSPPSPRKQQQQQHHPNNATPAAAKPPYPTDPPHFPAPPAQQVGYLGIPVQSQRSHSQPPRVRFANHESDHSDSSSYSDSDSSPRRQYRHHKHNRSQAREQDRHLTRTSESARHSNRRDARVPRKEHKDRDTFLGASAGALVGDVILPGLGTAAGILLGGLGGRKYGKRSKSEEAPPRHHEHRHRDAYHNEEKQHSRGERASGSRSKDFDREGGHDGPRASGRRRERDGGWG